MPRLSRKDRLRKQHRVEVRLERNAEEKAISKARVERFNSYLNSLPKDEQEILAPLCGCFMVVGSPGEKLKVPPRGFFERWNITSPNEKKAIYILAFCGLFEGELFESGTFLGTIERMPWVLLNPLFSAVKWQCDSDEEYPSRSFARVLDSLIEKVSGLSYTPFYMGEQEMEEDIPGAFDVEFECELDVPEGVDWNEPKIVTLTEIANEEGDNGN